MHKLISVREAAKLLGVSPLTVKRYIYSNKLKAIKLAGSGQYRINLSELERFLGYKLELTKEEPQEKEIDAKLNQLKAALLEELSSRLSEIKDLVAAAAATAAAPPQQRQPQVEVKVLGIGCRDCDKLSNFTCEILERQLALAEVPVIRIKDVAALSEFGPLKLPALILNNKLVVQGRVPSKGQLSQLIYQALN